MSLFSKLQSLGSDRINRLEDYHTEIVVYLLENSPELTVKWLASLGLTEKNEPDQLFKSDPIQSGGAVSGGHYEE